MFAVCNLEKNFDVGRLERSFFPYCFKQKFYSVYMHRSYRLQLFNSESKTRHMSDCRLQSDDCYHQQRDDASTGWRKKWNM